MFLVDRPQANEYGEYYGRYVSLVPEADVLAVLVAQPDEVRTLAATVSPERETFRYESGKWSIREVLGHVADSERVFGYRTLCIARGEDASLPSFDENAYARVAEHDRVPLARLAEQFSAARAVTLDVVCDLDPTSWARRGVANGVPVTVRALSYIMAGHLRHLLRVLRDRYAVGAPAGVPGR
jgi:hypothetical protein